MNTMVKIPQGDEKVQVELTVKELMALAGIRFHGNHNLEVAARKKLNRVIEETYVNESPAQEDAIPYQMLS